MYYLQAFQQSVKVLTRVGRKQSLKPRRQSTKWSLDWGKARELACNCNAVGPSKPSKERKRMGRKYGKHRVKEVFKSSHPWGVGGCQELWADG